MGKFGSFLEFSFILLAKISNLRTFLTVCSYKTGYRRSGMHERRNFFRQGGMVFLRPGEKSVPSTHKKNSTVRVTPKKIRLGIEPTTYGYNFNPMVNLHWGAGRLSRGIGHTHIHSKKN